MVSWMVSNFLAGFVLLDDYATLRIPPDAPLAVSEEVLFYFGAMRVLAGRSSCLLSMDVSQELRIR